MKLFVRLILVSIWVSAAPAAAADWPLTPRPEVVRGFEPPPEPWLPGHRGVDLLGRVGQQVRSPVAGIVRYAGPLAGRGVVVVAHGETRTTYEPVLASVRAGDRVAAGAGLGTLSAVSSHCAPRVCLHWGLVRGTTYLDPLSLIGSVPVRLLPLSDAPGDFSGSDRSGAGPVAETLSETQPTDQRSVDQRSSVAGGVAVGISGVVAVGGAWLIRRH